MDTVLFLNHKARQCGVYQYGYRTGGILKKSTAYNFLYSEVESRDEFLATVKSLGPIAVLYNYHFITMPWLDRGCLLSFPAIKHLGLHHENDFPKHIGFEHYIILDSTFADSGDKTSVPRPLFETVEAKPRSAIPIIGSFGFLSSIKGFGRLIKTVNDQFDEAIIRIHIPRPYTPSEWAKRSEFPHDQAPSLPNLHEEVKKEKIRLEITSAFMSDEDLLGFLASNTLNAFLYDDAPGRGLSSVIDYALSVKVPMAITRTYMFRHVYNTKPSICVENRSLAEIIASGSEPLQQYRELWSRENLVRRYESIILRATGRKPRMPSGGP